MQELKVSGIINIVTVMVYGAPSEIRKLKARMLPDKMRPLIETPENALGFWISVLHF